MQFVSQLSSNRLWSIQPEEYGIYREDHAGSVTALNYRSTCEMRHGQITSSAAVN